MESTTEVKPLWLYSKNVSRNKQQTKPEAEKPAFECNCLIHSRRKACFPQEGMMLLYADKDEMDYARQQKQADLQKS